MANPRTLAELTYELAVELKTIREGVTTTAGINTFVDTLRAESDDYWNTGAAWILQTSDGSAPQGEFALVTDFGGGTVTLAESLSATVPVGAKYALGRRRYPYDILRQSINAAYRDIGDIPATDTTLTTASQTTQYTIPAAVRKSLKQVWLQTILDVDADLGWVQIPYGVWTQENNLLFLPQMPIDRTLKLVYIDYPEEMYDFDDTISDYVHPSRVIYKAATHALSWRAERLSPAQQNQMNQRINYYLDLDLRAQFKWPIELPKRGNKLLYTSKFSVVGDDDFTTPGPA